MQLNSKKSLWSKIASFFTGSYQSWLNLKRRQNLVTKLEERVSLTVPFLILVWGASIICTFGLLLDSSAVVIGAMLIAPIFWPILGFSLSVIIRRKSLAVKSLTSLTVAVISAVLISFVMAKLVPSLDLNNEISLRIRPTGFDLLIAFVSSIIGVAAVYFPKISSTAIGVAISLSLLPPLCVSGISLAFGSRQMFLGSLLLFAVNKIAIIFAGLISFFVLGFVPKNKNKSRPSAESLILSMLLFVLLLALLAIFVVNRSI